MYMIVLLLIPCMASTHLDVVHTLHLVLLDTHNAAKCLERPFHIRSEFRVILLLLTVQREREGQMYGLYMAYKWCTRERGMEGEKGEGGRKGGMGGGEG